MYLNENDPKTAAWLRALGFGEVDERSIVDVRPADTDDESHFFAGIGGWPYALDLAGWTGPVWTGSCPCQPFSVAGRGGGTSDSRHLWPEWYRLIRECKPPVIFGEQVASVAGREWLAGVRADLEALGYAVGAADLCAASVGAPHIRQRLFWVADTGRDCVRGEGLRAVGSPESGVRGAAWERERVWIDAGAGGAAVVGWLGDANQQGPQGREQRGDSPSERTAGEAGVGPSRLAQPTSEQVGRAGQSRELSDGNWWSNFDIIPCADGKSRRIESGSFPLAHGVPARVVRLRGYGNAIVPQVAAEFVKAYMEVRGV